MQLSPAVAALKADNKPGLVAVAVLCAVACLGLFALGLVAPSPAFATEGPIASYPFNENEGELAHDSADGHDGTIEGASWVKGRYGSALKFNGKEEDVLTIPNSPDLELTEAFTLETWVRPTTSDSFAPIVTKEKASEEYFSYALDTGGEEPGVPEGRVASGFFAEESVEGSEELPLNTWSHLTLTFDGEQLRLYVDGELINVAPASAPQSGEGALQIGGANPFFIEGFYSGKIDEVRLYDRALDIEEIEGDMETPIEGSEGSEVPGEPECEDIEATVVPGQPRHLALPCEGSGELTYEIASEPEHGSLSGFNPATGAVDYVFEPGFSGGDSFTFDAENAISKSSPATATIEACGAPEVYASDALIEPEVPGVNLAVSSWEGEPYCHVGGEEAYIKSLRIYVDEELVFSEEPNCEDPENPCAGGMSWGLQLPFAKVIGPTPSASRLKISSATKQNRSNGPKPPPRKELSPRYHRKPKTRKSPKAAKRRRTAPAGTWSARAFSTGLSAPTSSRCILA